MFVGVFEGMQGDVVRLIDKYFKYGQLVEGKIHEKVCCLNRLII